MFVIFGFYFIFVKTSKNVFMHKWERHPLLYISVYLAHRSWKKYMDWLTCNEKTLVPCWKRATWAFVIIYLPFTKPWNNSSPVKCSLVLPTEPPIPFLLYFHYWIITLPTHIQSFIKIDLYILPNGTTRWGGVGWVGAIYYRCKWLGKFIGCRELKNKTNLTTMQAAFYCHHVSAILHNNNDKIFLSSREDHSSPQAPSTSHPYPYWEHHSLYPSFNCHIFEGRISFKI